MKRTRLGLFLAALLGVGLLPAVILMASRVEDQARFVTWPVVTFTALAVVVALVGIWVGVGQPSAFAIGLLPAIVFSYFLPAAPLPVIAVVLVIMASFSIAARGVASGIAAGTGTLMIVFVVLQGPAVECGETSVSGNSGPWWIDEPTQGTMSGTATAGVGQASGTVQVGDSHYSFVCAEGRLTNFERLAENEAPHPLPQVVPAPPGDG